MPKKKSIGKKILFWLFIGFWFYPCKWLLINIPVWCVNKILVGMKNIANQPKNSSFTLVTAKKPRNFEIIKDEPVSEKTSEPNEDKSVLENTEVIGENKSILETSEVTQSPTPPQKIIKDWTFEEAVDLYIYTGHYSCKSVYNYYRYFSDAFECILRGLKEYPIVLSDEKVLRQKEILNPIDDTKNITKSTSIYRIKNFIAIDTETTGLKTGGNDIIEISAIKFIDFRPVEIFHTYLKPRNPIPLSATIINNISNDMVADAPTFSQIKQSLQEFIGDFPLVAHNSGFDMNFLHVSGLNLEKHKGKVYDTLKLARLKIRDEDGNKLESYKLEDICEEQNIECSNFHSASSDALACGILFIDIIKKVHDVNSVKSL